METEEKKLIRKGRLQGFLITFIIMSVLGAVIIFATGVLLLSEGSLDYSFIYGSPGKSVLDKKAEHKIETLQAIIEKNYLNDYTEEDLKDGLYKGMMEGLNDPYSVYYTKEEYDELTEDSEGVFEGIGAYLSQNPDTMVVTVTRPIPDSPAEKAGILAGDILVEVDGENVEGDDLNVTVAKIRGKAGTKVNIGVKREGRDGVIRFDITRASVESMTVDSEMLDDSIGYIQIMEFDDVTYSQFMKAYKALQREEMTGLIIDLRDNPGGSVQTCVEIADELLPEGLIVYTEEKDGKREEYKSDGSSFYDGPLVLLVNGNSASAAEILTGAVKDYELGTVLGTTTYGKGIVQQILPLGDGTGVKVTIANYFSPKGNNIHGVGIVPDEELELDVDAYLDDGVDNQLDRAVEIIKEKKK
ncbi:MAG: S41 family peptidase [Lachnospiraceae bacterium]|nr:S41 family peptidase [Lachnospiraceae bacterium]MBR5765210.1 S41 family peptidase [Lachnospiraceae bacterium]MBR6485578.1 S41 family peptidase [Lachnospiraceae bacterium]